MGGSHAGTSAALNGARKPGFACMDAGERHSRAGRASVPVRLADERSEGTAMRREDPLRRGDHPAGLSPVSSKQRQTNANSAVEITSILPLSGNSDDEAQTGGSHAGASAALNGARKPGFACMDAGERRSRAGRASVPVRLADERSEGTATRREDPLRRGIHPAALVPVPRNNDR
ncbi:hypothetical protein EC836_103547 [Erwinia sp. JUb26]|nr:hypothetical protein EC836_103547 [Erwinia sp. JUb26]